MRQLIFAFPQLEAALANRQVCHQRHRLSSKHQPVADQTTSRHVEDQVVQHLHPQWYQVSSHLRAHLPILHRARHLLIQRRNLQRIHRGIHRRNPVSVQHPSRRKLLHQSQVFPPHLCLRTVLLPIQASIQRMHLLINLLRHRVLLHYLRPRADPLKSQVFIHQRFLQRAHLRSQVLIPLRFPRNVHLQSQVMFPHLDHLRDQALGPQLYLPIGLL